ncbi:hypothetical protein N9260_01765 [bacterium]|nr:hypothetical protein [bacterium]
MANINASLGDRRVVETIVNDADAVTPEWLEAVETMIPDFLNNVAPERLKVEKGAFVLRGVTGTSQIADAHDSFIQRAFPKSAYSVTNEPAVRECLNLGNSKVTLSAEGLAAANDSLFDVLTESTIYFGSGRTGLGSGDKRKLRKLAR